MSTARHRPAFLVLLAAGCSPAPESGPLPVTSPVVVAVAPDAAAAIDAVDAPGTGSPSRSEASVSESALQAWSRQSQCAAYDYFPRGGIRSFWCHRPARVTLAAVRSLAGVDIFTSGPHTSDTLKLDVVDDFGHYNPAFVRWLADHAGPSAHGTAARRATQGSYDAYLRPLAEVFWRTYEKARKDEACFAREKNAYANAIARKKLPKDHYERWFFFMNPFFCEKGMQVPKDFYYDNAFDGGMDGNVAKTVVGFWLRRAIDGTMDAFAGALRKLITSYEPELLAAPYRPADAAATLRAIEAGTQATAACKDPRAKLPTVYVAITVSGNGRVEAWIKSPALKDTPQGSCIEASFGAQHVPAFEGRELRFTRTVPLK